VAVHEVETPNTKLPFGKSNLVKLDPKTCPFLEKKFYVFSISIASAQVIIGT
jgi:hypothetical protein